MTDVEQDKRFINMCITLAAGNIQQKSGGPFAAIVVKDGAVVATGVNCVTATNDPTAHAEIEVIRKACKVINNYQLTGCTLYANCEPCPMCLGAIYWARPEKVVYAATRQSAAKAGFDDAFIYEEMERPFPERTIKMYHFPAENSELPFELWKKSEGKKLY
ncbi:MAG: nucleoside deaminase [Bacteroidales bacterium]|nr:nucleoside deaminase [Bacteroidales bacterium]